MYFIHTLFLSTDLSRKLSVFSSVHQTLYSAALSVVITSIAIRYSILILEIPSPTNYKILFLIKIILKRCRNQSKRNILRTNTWSWSTRQFDCQNERKCDIFVSYNYMAYISLSKIHNLV